MKGMGGKLITGMALGGGIMYLLDPQSGIKRRAMVREKTVRLSRQAGRTIGETSRTMEASYRRVVASSRDAVAVVRRLAANGKAVDDSVLAERMRACVARHSSYPDAIVVAVREGRATLSGPVLASEVREVLECGSAVQGVIAVDNKLEVHAAPGTVMGLQGEPHRRGMLRFWEASPALRVAAGATAASLVALVAGRRLMG